MTQAGELLAPGAYVVADGTDVVVVATGAEVSLALRARRMLSSSGVCARVPSIPSRELFEAQPPVSRQETLPPGRPRLAVEVGRRLGWCEFVDDAVFLEHFGASAPVSTLSRAFGFTPEQVAAWALALVVREEA